MSELLDELAKYKGPWLFWTCPKGCNGYVTWTKAGDKHFARCESCGETSQPMVPRQQTPTPKQGGG